MGIIASAVQAASSTKNGVVAATVGTAWTLSGLPWSSIAAIGTTILSAFYFFTALPRIGRTAVAIKRGLFNHDWTLWKQLGEQPAPKDE